MLRSMVLRWLQMLKYRGAKQDILRFLELLKGASAEEVAGFVASATFIRYKLNSPDFPFDKILENYNTSSSVVVNVQYSLGKLVRKLQSNGQMHLAGGAMVWLHSIRAFSTPEIRVYAQEMWKELSRGFEYAEVSLYIQKELYGLDFPENYKFDFYFIPDGLKSAK